MCCGSEEGDNVMADGNRLDVFFVHPSRGKRMVTGSATKEKLGYIGYGSYISNVHETDVAARPTDFICGVCQKPFTVIRDTAYCRTCFPPVQQPRPQLGDMRPRSAQERITAADQRQNQLQHEHFRNQPLDPWQEQQAVAPSLPPPPPPQQQEPAFNPPPPELPPPPTPGGEVDDPTQAVAAARQQKEQALGIPVIAPGEIGPPPNLAQSMPNPAPKPPTIREQLVPTGVTETKIVDLDFGRSVNAKHKETLVNNGVVTLYDAMKLGNTGLEAINGIGAGVSSAIMMEVDKKLAT